MRGDVSNTNAAATGASWLPSDPLALMLGRASARANSAIAPARNSSSKQMPQLQLPPIGMLARAR